MQYLRLFFLPAFFSFLIMANAMPAAAAIDGTQTRGITNQWASFDCGCGGALVIVGGNTGNESGHSTFLGFKQIHKCPPLCPAESGQYYCQVDILYRDVNYEDSTVRGRTEHMMQDCATGDRLHNDMPIYY